MSTIRYSSSFIVSSIIYIAIISLYFNFLDKQKPIIKPKEQKIKIALINPPTPIVPKKIEPKPIIKKITPSPVAQKLIQTQKPKSKPKPKPKIKHKPKPKKKVIKRIKKHKKVVKKIKKKRKIVKKHKKIIKKAPKKIVKKTPKKKIIKKKRQIVKKAPKRRIIKEVKRIVKKIPKKRVIKHREEIIYSEPQEYKEIVYTRPKAQYHHPTPKKSPPPRIKPKKVVEVQPKKINNNKNTKRIFLKKVRAGILANKRYPLKAKRRNIQGRVHATFDILANGDITNIRLSTAPRILKREVARALRKSFPISIPQSLSSEFPMRNVSVNIDFRLN